MIYLLMGGSLCHQPPAQWPIGDNSDRLFNAKSYKLLFIRKLKSPASHPHPIDLSSSIIRKPVRNQESRRDSMLISPDIYVGVNERRFINADYNLDKSFELNCRVMQIDGSVHHQNISPPAYAEAATHNAGLRRSYAQEGTTMI